MAELYEAVGSTYATTRQADPRIVALIEEALGDARSILNVGAGTGSYEPSGRTVIAVEPSAAMIERRPRSAAAAVQGRAEALPLADASVDAALAVFTIHHWSDARAGLREIRRVARHRAVILTVDPGFVGPFWLTAHYLPALERWALEHFPPLSLIEEELGPLTRMPVPVPHDCLDGFERAFWRRPEAYLDPNVRRNISLFALVDQVDLEEGLERLRGDLETGEWERRFGNLRHLDELDVGYCLLTASWTNTEVAQPI